MYVQQICRKRAAVRDDGGIQWLLLAKWLNCADNERTTATTMTTLTPTTNVRYHNNNNNGDNDGRQFVCNTVSVCFFSFSFFFHILLIRIEDKLCTSQRFSCLACTRLSFSTTSATITTGAEYKKKKNYIQIMTMTMIMMMMTIIIIMIFTRVGCQPKRRSCNPKEDIEYLL